MTGRPVAGLWISFFAAAFLADDRQILKDRLQRAALCCAVFGMFAFVIAAYNFARFGNPIEGGYAYQTYDGIFHRDWNVPGNIAGPSFNLANVPTNFQTFAFGLPNRQTVGVSVFLMSPFLIYLLRGKRWERTDWLISVNALIIIVLLLAFRSTGFRQAGYRFSLDFMPFVFWLLMRRHAALAHGFKTLILVATAIDLGLVTYFVMPRF